MCPRGGIGEPTAEGGAEELCPGAATERVEKEPRRCARDTIGERGGCGVSKCDVIGMVATRGRCGGGVRPPSVSRDAGRDWFAVVSRLACRECEWSDSVLDELCADCSGGRASCMGDGVPGLLEGTLIGWASWSEGDRWSRAPPTRPGVKVSSAIELTPVCIRIGRRGVAMVARRRVRVRAHGRGGAKGGVCSRRRSLSPPVGCGATGGGGHQQQQREATGAGLRTHERTRWRVRERREEDGSERVA